MMACQYTIMHGSYTMCHSLICTRMYFAIVYSADANYIFIVVMIARHLHIRACLNIH
jgi:hypothetical protein